MTCVVVHNAFGTVAINGQDLPVDCSRGVETPVTITGNGGVYISVNPNIISQDVYDDTGLILITPAVFGPPASVTISDALGHITIIDENTRFPQEGNFPILHDPLVVT